jgi:hypothetical protein
VPLPPGDVERIWHAIRPYQFEHAMGAWPARDIIGSARAKVRDGVRRFIKMEGWSEDAFDLDYDELIL